VCIETVEDIVNILSKKSKTCAIVDREELYSEHLAKVLYDLGFNVYLFNNKEDFESSYGEAKFDIVIVSWDIEVLMGENIVEIIRQYGKPYASVIIGCDEGVSLSFQMSFPPSGFLFKPFNAKRFFEVIQRVLVELEE